MKKKYSFGKLFKREFTFEYAYHLHTNRVITSRDSIFAESRQLDGLSSDTMVTFISKYLSQVFVHRGVWRLEVKTLEEKFANYIFAPKIVKINGEYQYIIKIITSYIAHRENKTDKNIIKINKKMNIVSKKTLLYNNIMYIPTDFKNKYKREKRLKNKLKFKHIKDW